MATPPCAIPTHDARTASSSSSGAHAHSYSASLPPTYRLSAFPVSPTAQDCIASTSASTTGALPPGFGLEQRGCTGDDSSSPSPSASPSRRLLPPSPPPPSSRPTRTVRGFECPDLPRASTSGSSSGSGSGSGADGRSASASSRDSSARSASSSSCCADDGDGDGGGDATPLSSLAGSVVSVSSECSGPLAPPRSNLAAKLEWGVKGLVVTPSVPKDDAAKREREARAVRGGWEDPALAAARRALWDDVVSAEDDDHDTAPAQAGADALRGKDAEGASPPEEGGDADAPEQHDEQSDGASQPPEEDGDDAEAWGLPPVRRPCHATLAPRSSCLRYSPAARASLSLPSSSCPSSSDDPTPSGRHSPSAASTTSTSEAPSVSFSCAPPQTCPTWSAEAYSRRGDAPVEKLSIREWIELQGVREAVGVWSGKIAKWDEATLAAVEGAATSGAGAAAGAGGDQPGTPTRGRPPGGLAAVVGVVHISRSTPTSPVDPNRTFP